jgi:hypothetical protein
METLFHKNFGKGQKVSEDATFITVNFESCGEKKLNKKFATFCKEEEVKKVGYTTPKIEIKRHALELASDILLISVLKKEESSMQRNMYFNSDEVVNTTIYTDGVDFYNSNKELIGDSWKLAMYFAKTK